MAEQELAGRLERRGSRETGGRMVAGAPSARLHDLSTHLTASPPVQRLAALGPQLDASPHDPVVGASEPAGFPLALAPAPPVAGGTGGIGLVRSVPDEKAGSDQAVVQGVFITTDLTADEKAMQAFEIFRAGLPSGSESAFLRDAPFVEIDFTLANLSKANGDTSVMVDLGGDAIGKYQNAAGKLGGYNKIANRKTYITVRLNRAFVAANTPGAIAKTLAHEIGTHAAPYAELYRRTFGPAGLTEGDVEHFEKMKAGEGGGDHVAIRDRQNLEYENIVKQIALQLGGSRNTAAREVVLLYLLDISRYTTVGQVETEGSTVQSRARENLALPEMAWAKPYVQTVPSSAPSAATVGKLLIALAIAVGLVAAFLHYSGMTEQREPG